MTTQITDKERTTLLEQATQLLSQLPPEQLRSAFDFLRYLHEREGWEATRELEAIPGFNENLERARQQIKTGDVVRFEDLDKLLAVADDETEDEILAKSGLLPRLLAEAEQAPADPNWEQTLDEL